MKTPAQAEQERREAVISAVAEELEQWFPRKGREVAEESSRRTHQPGQSRCRLFGVVGCRTLPPGESHHLQHMALRSHHHQEPEAVPKMSRLSSWYTVISDLMSGANVSRIKVSVLFPHLVSLRVFLHAL